MNTKRLLRCAILFSGRGSNLHAIANAVSLNQLPIAIVAAVTDRPASGGLKYALEYALPTWIIDPKQYKESKLYEQQLATTMDNGHVDLIILAGFMRILSGEFVTRYTGKIINLHPSLLPKYRGLNTHQHVIKNQDKVHGSSVHVVTPELDAGPVIAQYQMSVYPADTAIQLAERLMPHEHRLLLAVIALFTSRDVTVSEHTIRIDQHPLNEPLLLDRDIHWSIR